ncbi:hypothetical protein [Cupriavidus sp. 2SB]|uniref:hypothetical protein n=1 Tax=unclassified Cupriavidus TaxID=2640874 RepID=UPI0010F7A8E8|nr:hypothetical protein [Cupriavidus sp. 2SB]
MRSHRTVVTILATATLAWPFAQAIAGPPEAEASATAAAAASAGPEGTTAVAVAEARTGIFGTASRAVGADKLADVRGGAETVVNDMTLRGMVGSNAAVNTYSGQNMISEGSFANSAGLPTVIQNTGNNVLIQNATILNVQFK